MAAENGMRGINQDKAGSGGGCCKKWLGGNIYKLNLDIFW